MANPSAASTDPWTGEPSQPTRRRIAILRRLRTVTDIFGISFGRTFAPLMSIDHPPRSAVRGLSVARSEFRGWPVYTLRSASPSSTTVVAIHGGAFSVEPTRMHWRDYAAVCRDTGAIVVVPIYPLVPRGRAADVVPQMADLFTSLLEQPGVDRMSVYSDSAGGTLALAATQELVRRGLRIPHGLVLISPWLDLSMTNPDCTAVHDPVLGIDELRRFGQQWAADLDATDPLVSPLYESLDGLPPTAVYAGSLDLLGPDAVRLRQRAVTAGADMTFDLRRGLIHDWALPSSHEGREIRPQIYQQLLGI